MKKQNLEIVLTRVTKLSILVWQNIARENSILFNHKKCKPPHVLLIGLQITNILKRKLDLTKYNKYCTPKGTSIRLESNE